MLIYNLLYTGIHMINIGICGLGTVGQSTLEHIVKFKNEILNVEWLSIHWIYYVTRNIS